MPRLALKPFRSSVPLPRKLTTAAAGRHVEDPSCTVPATTPSPGGEKMGGRAGQDQSVSQDIPPIRCPASAGEIAAVGQGVIAVGGVNAEVGKAVAVGTIWKPVGVGREKGGDLAAAPASDPVVPFFAAKTTKTLVNMTHFELVFQPGSEPCWRQKSRRLRRLCAAGVGVRPRQGPVFAVHLCVVEAAVAADVRRRSWRREPAFARWVNYVVRAGFVPR